MILFSKLDLNCIAVNNPFFSSHLSSCFIFRLDCTSNVGVLKDPLRLNCKIGEIIHVSHFRNTHYINETSSRIAYDSLPHSASEPFISLKH